MTLQNEQILMEEAHRRVAQRLADAELERVGRQPRPKVRVAVAGALTLVGLAVAVVGVWVAAF
jgi:hypothetical protein